MSCDPETTRQFTLRFRGGPSFTPDHTFDVVPAATTSTSNDFDSGLRDERCEFTQISAAKYADKSNKQKKNQNSNMPNRHSGTLRQGEHRAVSPSTCTCFMTCCCELMCCFASKTRQNRIEDFSPMLDIDRKICRK